VKRVYVDSNVFLRFLTVDDAGQHKKAVKLFQKASEGKVHLISGPPVLFEIAWTLRSAYDLDRESVVDVIERIITTPGLEITDGAVAAAAVSVARERRLDFADAYVVANAQGAQADAVATFNVRHFKKGGLPLHPL